MKVWGIDPSSKCGIAILDTDRNLSAAHCEVLDMKDSPNYYWFAAQLGRKLRARVNTYGRPDLIVIEQGSESTQGTGINGIIWVWNVIGTVTGLFGVYGTPIATIHPATWRKPFYGQGFVCPQVPVMEKGVQVIEKGKPKFKNDWKAAAIRKCSDEGVTLPTQKTLAHNAAEAVGIAHSWAHSSVIDKEFYPAFQAMLQSRNERTAAPDMFAGAA